MGHPNAAEVRIAALKTIAEYERCIEVQASGVGI